MEKNLIYQICPLACNSIWEFNVDILLRYIDIFNGRLLITIKTGKHMVKPELVTEKFKNYPHAEFIIIDNDTHPNEAYGFYTCLEKLAATAKNESTFYAHSKGVSPKYLPEDYINLNQWTEALYTHNLKDSGRIDELLQQYRAIGCFKRNRYFKNINSDWHYSGTFFWFRHDAVFENQQWNDSSNTAYYAVEGFLGRLIDSRSAYCIYGENPGDLYLYRDSNWQKLNKKHPRPPKPNWINKILYGYLKFKT